MLLQGLQGSPLSGHCPACAGDKRTTQFDWRLLKTDLPKMLPVQKLQTGSLLRCSVCHQNWYLDEVQEKITSVPEERVSLLKTWGSALLSLSPELFKKAKTIGATPVHAQARHSQYAEVPCQVRIGDQRIDKCLIIFTDAAPLAPDFGAAHLLNEILDIEPSSYALSPEIRLATCRSKPDSEGKAPTFVETEKGKLLSLNWTVNFVDYKKIKGSDLRLSDTSPASLKKKKQGKTALLQEPIDDLTFFIGHWSSEISKLKIN